MKKLLALLMALIFVFTFAACSSEGENGDKKDDTKVTNVSDDGNDPTPSTPVSPTDAAEKAANEFFTKVKTASGEELIELTGESVADIPLSDKAVAIQLFDAITSKFDYKIISSEQVNDTTVNVKVNFTTVDAEAAVGIFFGEMLSYAMSAPNATEEEISIKSVELMAKAFSSPDVGTANSESTVEVKLVDGKWTIEFDDDLFNTISGDLQGAMESLTNDLQ